MSRQARRHVLRLSLLVAISIVAGTSLVAWGQDRSGRAERPAPSRTGGSATRPGGAGGAGGSGSKSAAKVRAEGDLVEEGGQKVKVFRFGEFDISGRLKSPQLLYFLNRVRAEFERPRLPHRSFMPELKRSTKSRAF
ncbi:MAG: hypothetical protein IT379_23875 [Deltaproteobacteria bacterium]|nr:hypothetical protein [Deltaproteobacteria bacterium]